MSTRTARSRWCLREAVKRIYGATDGTWHGGAGALRERGKVRKKGFSMLGIWVMTSTA